MNQSSRDKNQGFTLVELAIVLVIVGLLVGGVLVGRTLIRAAEMRSVITNFSEMQIGVKEFQTQYRGLPGDIVDATRFWGELNPVQATCITTPATNATGTKTCNGNGDGKIYVGSNESFRFWQHLSNAGLLAGKFTGVRGSGSAQHAIPSQNVPAFRGLSSIGWSFDESCSSTSVWYWDRPDEGNSLVLGLAGPLYSTEGGAFTMTEAWNIDKKIDDSKPGIGMIQIQPHLTTGTRTEATTAEYDLNNESDLTAIWFVKIF